MVIWLNKIIKNVFTKICFRWPAFQELHVSNVRKGNDAAVIENVKIKNSNEESQNQKLK